MADSFIQVPANVTGGNKVKSDLVGDIHTPIHIIQSGTVTVDNLPATQAIIGTVTDGTTPSDSRILLVGGVTSAGVAQAFETNGSGHLNVSDGGGSITIDNASLTSIDGKLSTSIVEMPNQNTSSLPVRQSPQKYTDISFSQVGSGLLALELTQISAGAGMTVSQSGGNLVIASGTTANAEFVARSVDTFNGALTLRAITTLSQRIANNNFFIELVDVIGDNLAYNIVNTTTVDVTLPAHGYTAQNVGQRIDLCAITGAAGVPQEGVIASIPNANTIRFTVAGFPASGSGTLSLTGWNKIEIFYTGTSATLLSFNTRRRGWANTAVSVSINTTASGHMAICNTENGIVSFADKALTAGLPINNRTSLDSNIPLPETTLYLQIRARNGTVAPASTTTWTLGMIRVEDYIPSQVSIVSTRLQSLNNSLIVSGSVNATVSGTTITGGQTAHSTASTGNPVRVAGRVNTAVDTTLVAGDACDLFMTTSGQTIVRNFAAPELDWFYNNAGAPITTTSTVALAAAAGAGVRRFLAAIQLHNIGTANVDLTIQDGSTNIWAGRLVAGQTRDIPFPIPLKTSANAALNLNVTVTAGGSLNVNAQGFNAV